MLYIVRQITFSQTGVFFSEGSRKKLCPGVVLMQPTWVLEVGIVRNRGGGIIFPTVVGTGASSGLIFLVDAWNAGSIHSDLNARLVLPVLFSLASLCQLLRLCSSHGGFEGSIDSNSPSLL